MAHRISNTFKFALVIMGITAAGCGGVDTGSRGLDAATICSNGTCITTCPDGTYLSGGACVDVTSCLPGTYVALAASADSDQICAACPDGMFNTGLNKRSCVPWTVCSAGSY